MVEVPIEPKHSATPYLRVLVITSQVLPLFDLSCLSPHLVVSVA
jgi:hypothetical protein